MKMSFKHNKYSHYRQVYCIYCFVFAFSEKRLPIPSTVGWRNRIQIDGVYCIPRGTKQSRNYQW